MRGSVLDRHERFSGSYFWTPPANASGRRRMELDNSETLRFRFGGEEYSVEQSVDCSCKNIYYRLLVTVDGKKKDVRAIRKLV